MVVIVTIYGSDLVCPAWFVGHAKRKWYLSDMQMTTAQASLPICTVSPEPSLLAYTCCKSKGNFNQRVRLPAPLKGYACTFKVLHV